MAPAKLLSEPDRKKRVEAFEQYRGTVRPSLLGLSALSMDDKLTTSLPLLDPRALRLDLLARA